MEIDINKVFNDIPTDIFDAIKKGNHTSGQLLEAINKMMSFVELAKDKDFDVDFWINHFEKFIQKFEKL